MLLQNWKLCKILKGPMDNTKVPDPGGSNQQIWEWKYNEERLTGTVGINIWINIWWKMYSHLSQPYSCPSSKFKNENARKADCTVEINIWINIWWKICSHLSQSQQSAFLCCISRIGFGTGGKMMTPTRVEKRLNGNNNNNNNNLYLYSR